MEHLIGPNLEVVLSLIEGFDFGFLNTAFIVVASLDGNLIQTNSFDNDQSVKFDIELIWTTNKTNVRKMRVHKVPIRLDLYKVGNQRERIGYIILSLKVAQYLPRGATFSIRQETYKVYGLGKDAKGSCPQIALSLIIQDAKLGNTTERVNNVSSLNINDSSLSLQLPPESFEKQATLLSPLRTGPDIKRFDEQNSNCIQAYHSFHLNINLVDITWLRDQPCVHFRFHHARADVTWSAHSDVTGASKGMCNKLQDLSAEYRFVEAPSQLEMLLREIPPVITVCTWRQQRPLVLAKADLLISTSTGVEVQHNVELTDLTSKEVVARLTYSARLSDIGPQTFRQLSCQQGDENIAERIKEELDAWKDNEKKIFQDECNNRLQQGLSVLQSQWADRQSQLEQQAKKQEEECKNLANSLQEATEKVKHYEQRLFEREQQFQETKNKLESSCRKLHADAQKETASLREDIMLRLREKDQIILQLRAENNELRQSLNIEEKSKLSRHQIETLLVDMKEMQEKLEKANNSKLFFKEQWGRVVRELHSIKTDGYNDIQVQLRCDREELLKLGTTSQIASGRETNRSRRTDVNQLRALIEKRDKRLKSNESGDDVAVTRLNREIRKLLDV